MLGAHQPFGRMAEISGAPHHGGEMGFPITHVRRSRAGLRYRDFRNSLVAFDPALTLGETGAFAIRPFGVPCPHPDIHARQGIALVSRHRLGADTSLAALRRTMVQVRRCADH